MSSKSDSTVDLGPLAGLVGTWQGSNGYNVIAVPSPNATPDMQNPDFTLLYQKYYETLTFEEVPAAARNRGGTLDQYIGAVTYKQVIHAADMGADSNQPFKTGELIHQETGMLLYLNNIQGTGASSPEYSIARSGTIPHGDSIMILGDYTTSNKKPAVVSLSSVPTKEQIGPTPRLGYTESYTVEAPEYLSNPTKALTDITDTQTITETTTFSLSSANNGGVTNIPFINTNAKATTATCQYFLEKVQNSSGTTTLQLQYSQNVGIEFGAKFGASGLITWPHITVNTLTKQSS